MRLGAWLTAPCRCGEVVTTIPTIGFNVESLTYKNVTLNVWDLGGQTTIRPYWRCYYSGGGSRSVLRAFVSSSLTRQMQDTNAIIFVVDSADTERLSTACEELHQMLQEEELRDAALLIFANKQVFALVCVFAFSLAWQDLPGALSEAAVSEKLQLSKLKGRPWAIYKASAVKGEGLEPGLDWLVGTISGGKK